MSLKDNKHSYGWRPDLPDQRDVAFVAGSTKVPAFVDLRNNCPPIYDQGQLGSCTANAVTAALDYERFKQGEPFISPSRLFVYYNERKAEGTISSDSGATIRESVKAVKSYGAPRELDWPYDITKFQDKPTKQCYAEAVGFEDLAYQRVTRSMSDMQAVLAGFQPFVAGISVYESFESLEASKTGRIPIPAKNEKLLGGHAILVVGYKDGEWICRNSWGTLWGDKGYFYFPYEYLSDSKLSSDFWTLTKVK